MENTPTLPTVRIHEEQLGSLGLPFIVIERAGHACGAAVVVKVVFVPDDPRGTIESTALI